MAIAFDASGHGSGTNVDTISWSHTSAPGVAGFILVAIAWQDFSADGTELYKVVHGGNTLSFICEYNTGAGYLSIWGGIPDSSLSNLGVYWTAPGADAVGISISFTGVFRDTPYQTPVHSSNTGSTMSCNITGLSTDNLFVDFIGMFRSGANEAPVPDVSQTYRNGLSVAIPSTSYERIACSTRPGIDTTITMQWTTSFSWLWQQVVIELVATPTKAMELALLGVGTTPAAT